MEPDPMLAMPGGRLGQLIGEVGQLEEEARRLVARCQEVHALQTSLAQLAILWVRRTC
jgi:hypothetical protein